jgi:phage baseplate assembly protein W
MAASLSDKNYFGASNVARKKIYNDLKLSLVEHPINHSVASQVNDIEAVKNALQNLILTNNNEKPFMPNYGGNIRALLFEPADILTGLALKSSILQSIYRYEPRVNQVAVQVFDDGDKNAYYITIGFNVIASGVSADTSFYIDRLQ